jgi:GAF domain-containing protein
MLAIVRKTMEAETAALLLFGARSCRLMTSGAAGFADQELDPCVGRSDGRPGDGTVAADTRAVELDVTKKLREGGVRALLGVRLPMRRLQGALYIGLRANRMFTRGEITLLDRLGVALSVQLDHAHHQASLNRVDKLTACPRPRCRARRRQ